MREDFTIGVEMADQPEVEALLQGARALLRGLYPPESRHGLDLGAYEDPEVTLFVARDAGVAVGCGACRLHGDGSAEVKSMFVAEARAAAASGGLLEAIEAALRAGHDLAARDRIKQLAAIRLYEAAGFRRRGPFGSYRDDPLSVFMEKRLPYPHPRAATRSWTAPASVPR